MKELICMVGLPRSGKSTEAKKLGYPIVSPDAIRLALYGKPYITEAEGMVWTIADYMVRSLFLAGHDKVIIDATNTTKVRRDRWQDDSWKTNFIVVNTPLDICLQRAKEANFPQEVIQRMYDNRELVEDLEYDGDLTVIKYVESALDKSE